MKHIESDIQKACVKWFRLQYPGLVLCSIPNEGKTSPQMGAIMKSMGLLAGMPDLILFAAEGGFNGLLIEMKSPEGRLTESQTAIHTKLKRKGYHVEVCRSFEQFKSIIENYLEA